MITYLKIFDDNGTTKLDFNDGFCCGYNWSLDVSEIESRIQDDRFQDEFGVSITSTRNKKAKTARDAWRELVAEIESGKVEEGFRVGFFGGNKRIVNHCRNFIEKVKSMGYTVNEEDLCNSIEHAPL